MTCLKYLPGLFLIIFLFYYSLLSFPITFIPNNLHNRPLHALLSSVIKESPPLTSTNGLLWKEDRDCMSWCDSQPLKNQTSSSALGDSSTDTPPSARVMARLDKQR